jgi:hypothetical protein
MKSPLPESAQGVSDTPEPAPARPHAALVLAHEGGERRYAMFELRELSVRGAVLAGGLLLEMDEELTMELALDEGAPMRVQARVVGLLRDLPGVEVSFPELGEHDRKRIENRTATAAET